MDIYAQIVLKIIEQQENIIGPVAVEQAKRVANLSVDWGSHTIKVSGDEAKVVDELVTQYEHLFGQLSVEVCKDATAQLMSKLPPDKQPKKLK